MKKMWKQLIFVGLTAMLLVATDMSAVAQEAAAGEPEQKETTFISIFFDADGIAKAICMWTMLIMSILVLTFGIELLLKLRISKLAPSQVVALLRDSLASGNYHQALEVCRANPCYLTIVFEACLNRIGRGREVAEGAIHEEATRQSNQLKSHNNYLSVIGVVAPMVGLTGTVLGMMSAFSALGGGVAQMSALSHSISVVLIATAFGLIVAVPAFVLFYYFKNVAQNVLVDANVEINNLVEDIPFEQLAGYKIEQAGMMGSQSVSYQ